MCVSVSVCVSGSSCVCVFLFHSTKAARFNCLSAGSGCCVLVKCKVRKRRKKGGKEARGVRE